LDGVDTLILRPAYFYNNFYANVGMVKHGGIIGANYGADKYMFMVDPADIADAAANAIETGFSGKSVQYIASDKRTMGEVAAVLGKAVGNPALPWIEFTDEQAYEGMVNAGLPPEIARNYVEMGTATKTGILSGDAEAQHLFPQGKIKLEDFAVNFAAVYNA